jgi:hypothetical protein
MADIIVQDLEMEQDLPRQVIMEVLDRLEVEEGAAGVKPQVHLYLYLPLVE